jgi:hypothetical protein
MFTQLMELAIQQCTALQDLALKGSPDNYLGAGLESTLETR